MNRRKFLKMMGVTSAGLALNSAAIAAFLAQTKFSGFTPDNRDPIIHMLNRLTYGATPDLYNYVKHIGIEAFIEEQLNPDTIDDSALEARLADYDTTHLSTTEILEKYVGSGMGSVIEQLVMVNILRARYSKRQLYERMNNFWTDHFHIFVWKSPAGFLKPVDEREVIRAHSLGTFPDMLRASAHSPAMLMYLDNYQSKKSYPNENYARELLELHTLGVDGGYTEQDVKDVARAFTGWTVLRPRNSDLDAEDRGEFFFRAYIHDKEEKHILGQRFRANQRKQDGDRVLTLLAGHTSTARFISTKLARRFISDYPPDSIVDKLQYTYLKTDGDIKQMMRTLINSEEFWFAPPKFKRPFEYTMSLLRAVDYQEDKTENFFNTVRRALDEMGQMPYMWGAPNGYPDMGEYWKNNLLPRWNMAIVALSERMAGYPNLERLEQMLQDAGINSDEGTDATLQFIARYLIGRDLSVNEADLLSRFMANFPPDKQSQAALALLIASPAFQFK